MHMNECFFIGRIATEPESRHTRGGDHVVTFLFAIPRKKKGHDADFIEVTCWKSTADFVSRYCHKGDLLTISGQLEQQRWEDNDGNKRSKHIINFVKIHNNYMQKNEVQEYGSGGNTFTELYDDDDDSSNLPF